jgi:hypothetical protein
MTATDQSVLNAQWNAAAEVGVAARMRATPSVLYRPALFPDGNMWCALYGDDLATGVAGFGPTPAAAMAEFDKAWATIAPPQCIAGGKP